MRKLILVSLLLGGLGLTTAPGCIVHSHRPRHGHVHRGHRHAPRRAHCAPSHYWDGHQCRHKGRGHGARKHDY